MLTAQNSRCSGIFYLLLLMASAAHAQRLASFSYIGCFIDFTDGVRDITGLSGLSILGSYNLRLEFEDVYFPGMTLNYCSRFCSVGGFPYFAVQNGDGCFCGSSYGSQGQASQSHCNSPCGGNASQMCGGFSRNSVFAQTYLDQNSFKVTAPIRLTRTTYYTLPTYWTITASTRIECVAKCDAVNCQAVIFSQQELLCYRLRFAALPDELAGVNGQFFSRV